ncbi:MAG: hypothetical protein J3Q66DRAFT_341064 [Benniella sp.]|nr:MAG: hypothetical protein J3Q66DRAFT_341064 [Benniella sp.]
MQVQSASPYNNNYTQHPYNPNMFASSPQPAAQYILSEQHQQQQHEQDPYLALQRLLMGIPPCPPTIPTIAKPTCPSLDDQLMAEIQGTSTSAPSSIPSIILNEHSFDLQFYQDHSDCSSRSVSPPSSPYSQASSLVSSPAMSMMDNAGSPISSDLFWMNSNTMVPQQHQQQQDWDFSLFDINMPMTMTTLEGCIAPENTTFLSQPPQTVPSQSSLQALRKTKTHHRRTSSTCSGISAYQANVHRQHRASSISSVCSSSSNSSTGTATASTTTTTTSTRPTKSYACGTCAKTFPTRTQLKSHMAIHTDSFPFPCEHPGCELHFKRKHDLRRHVDAKHATVKKYLCEAGCGEGFGRRDQMVRHMRRGTCQGQGCQSE